MPPINWGSIRGELASPTARRAISTLVWSLSALAALVGAYLLFFPIAKSLARDAYGGADLKIASEAVASARTLIASILGATAALAGIYLTWANQNRTQRESLRSQALSRQAVELAREGRASENFIKAVDQLGSDTVSTRIGGVFGLGRLLRTAVPGGDYWPIMDVLNSFVRNWSRSFDRTKATREPPEDVQAALTVIARRSLSAPGREGDAPVDLHECFLQGAYLSYANLQAAYLDKVDLTNATLNQADLYRAWLKNAEMSSTSLVGALLVEVNFEDADLSRSNMSGAELRGAQFRRTNLHGAIVTQAQIETALGDLATRLPAGLTRPSHWTA
jgi:uncharacterized protein YjbI with pentapeptide repeats